MTASYGGLSPITRRSETGGKGVLDDVLEKIKRRLSDTRGSKVEEGDVLTKWLMQRGIVVIT